MLRYQQFGVTDCIVGKTGNLGELSLNRFTMPLTATARHVGFVMD